PVIGIDLQKCTDEELVQYQLHENEWYARHARRILQERFAANQRKNVDEKAAVRKEKILGSLATIALRDENEVRCLRALWTCYCCGYFSNTLLCSAAGSRSAQVRAWAIQLGIDSHGVTELALDTLGEVAGSERSPIVRRYLASAAQRLSPEARREIVK